MPPEIEGLTPEQIGKKAEETFGALQALMDDLKESKNDGADRISALSAKADELGNDVAALMAAKAQAEGEQARDSLLERLQTQIDAIAEQMRNPSKAGAVLSGKTDDVDVDIDEFFRTLVIATNPKAPIRYRERAEKALELMGSEWRGIPEDSKAVLGDTDATGGYVAPRAIVAEITSVAVANNPYRSLMEVVSNTLGPTIDVPHIGLQPTRAVVVGRGQTKTNVGIGFANYTATMYTLAQIIDAGNQWLRQTRGRGEQIIRKRLGEALALGEAYYILQGSGSSEPKGILTSIGESGTFVTAHTAATTTVAGSLPAALAKAAGDLADRARTPDGAVMNAGDFWRTLAYGSDTAGFWVAPGAGPASVNAAGFQNGSPALRMWNTNLGIYPDANMPLGNLVVGQWKGAELYLGEAYRLDTSTEAGDRWDKNLTGFRAEEEIAFNADPYVAAGLFQRVLDVTA